MSVASTRPVGPTRAASHSGTDMPPAPTSQHRQPEPTPISRRWLKVERSNRVASASNRVPAWICWLASR